jgi:aspartyl-tRNA(Asn)/glutamyl-tRNA(Gln) amidotransferase subunit C
MISEEEVKRVAKLSRIRLSDEEVPSFKEQLSKITDVIDQLKQVEADGVPPLITVCPESRHMREDEVDEGGSQKELFANVPDDNREFAKEINCYIVPKMVD